MTYLRKAARESKRHTSWTDPDEDYEKALERFAGAVLADESILESVQSFCDVLAAPARVAILGQKLVQLTMPGVPDVYQGCEVVDLSLVDPDNRRDVDFARRRAALATLDGAGPHDLDTEKLLVTSRALALRRAHPEWFVGPGCSYAPVATTTGNVIAFARGDGSGEQVVSVATRLPVALERRGGWGTNTIEVPAGPWSDTLTGRSVHGGAVLLADLLVDLPVALLTRA